MKRLCAVLVALSSASWAGAVVVVPVDGWTVHNGTSAVGGTAANPTFTPGDNITVMAPFADVTLASDGDFVEGKVTLTMSGRTTTGVNTLNTQLRFGLFHDGVNASVTAGDAPNVGYIIEYTNLSPGGLIREQTNLTQTSPFASPTNLGNGSLDATGDSIQGANPGPVVFDLRLIRDGGKIDLVGTISGTDAVSGNPYVATYEAVGLNSLNFPANTPFTFNRIALFLGDGVNAASASLSDVSITAVPEPTGPTLAAGAVFTVITSAGRRISRRVTSS